MMSGLYIQACLGSMVATESLNTEQKREEDKEEEFAQCAVASVGQAC